ncbi:MAG TPA: molybdopterin dinucleotide binding domain-containing protein, partial [Acidimicrobiia bacterium]|nr:molybdopterin dinucleotide binding domain-containing protein [Acidimicrobiia bacterium]
GVDGHNSHTNVCSSGARSGYHYWLGIDRPSPDFARAKIIYLISSHLEAGHYFNPHAQRIMEAKRDGAKIVVLDTRLSNSATHADWWLAPYPGSEAAINLSIARHIIVTKRYDREYVRRWWNWAEYLAAEQPDGPQTFEAFEAILADLYAEFTFDYAAAESGVDAEVIAEVADAVAGAGTQFSSHNWRSAAAGNLGGWQVSRTLFLINALLGAVATPGGMWPNAWNKFIPAPIHNPPHPHVWNELTWPVEFPLALNEMSFLLPHFLKEGRGKLEVYFSRVYNPVWTNPDGFSWLEALTDEAKVACHVALTPTWSETAFVADYVLPMGLASERHDTHSYEQYDGQWVGFRQPVQREVMRRRGEAVSDTREVNPGEVWEENEFWIELSWRIDPDGALGIRRYHESRAEPGTKLTVDEYYAWMFENSVPGLPETAAREGLTPLDYMRRFGAFEVGRNLPKVYEQPVPTDELVDVAEGRFGRIYTAADKPPSPNVVPTGAPDPDPAGRRAVGVRVDGEILQGFPTPSGRLEFWSSTLAQWGWAEHALPGYIRSHIHRDRLEPDQFPLISTFRLPVQVHTRTANSKWLDEIAHTNPLWIHPSDAARLGNLRTGDLVRVETGIGHYVVKAWVTEGIRPGVVACSHHMGRWKPAAGIPTAPGAPAASARGNAEGQRQMMSTVDLERSPSGWSMRRRSGVGPYESSDPDTLRIWWTDAGVHQNLTFPVQPDPISGQHCWHQAVRVRRAEKGDRLGDIAVDTDKAHAAYHRWMELARDAHRVSPDGTRRPYWLMRPLKPAREVFALHPAGE